MADEMILGSGYLYITEFTTAIPADGDFEVAANKLGYIEGGASLEYKPTFYTAKDDLGLVTKTVITDEEVTLKSGICTLNGNTLKKLSATARVTEGSIRTVLKLAVSQIMTESNMRLDLFMPTAISE